ncbi:pyridoxamine 5'-phosphate oxidase family protein [Lysinibacillus fusiformis]|uniref:pyridoxamine 5'-phosphate oxidase family protein n=1 Tax=Lysinibacillus fusiformis TaxID=28031 RepID=UPI001EF658D3|nr:pyridoxamine 5'-phosphate oxidase family protein [Lysinibacillus fusiformis]MCG7434275.1 pyridoxamine 5'-phosphate oxidase family protein [Lysinibacillus fusiformis]
MPKAIDIEQVKQDYENFIQSKKNCVLSFVNGEGKPFSSTTPFVRLNGKFYVYISQVAEHYQLMDQSEVVDLICVADEAVTANPFAPERARWQCRPKKLGNEGHEDIFATFDQLFNAKMMELLRSLDFSLFELTPIEGRYVVGFGKAFTIDIANDTLIHVVVDKK